MQTITEKEFIISGHLIYNNIGNTMLQTIALKHYNGLYVPKNKGTESAEGGTCFVAEMMNYGYIADNELMQRLYEADIDTLTELYNTVMPTLKDSIGNNVKHRPMFPNFPNDLMDAQNTMQFTLGLTKLKLTGEWDNVTVKHRKTAWDEHDFKTLTLVEDEQIDYTFNTLVMSKDSISDTDKDIIKYLIETRDVVVPTDIPFRENMCLVAGLLLQQNKWEDTLVKDTDDILRVLAYINDGDISLATPTKYKSLPRKQRKLIVNALANVAKEADFVKYSQQWIHAFHNLHVGDYSKSLYNVAKKLRENINIETYNSKLDDAMSSGDTDKTLKLLVTRPGVFARTIANLLTTKEVKEGDENAFSVLKSIKTNEESAIDYNKIITAFNTIVDKVPTRNLTQLWGSVKTRYNDVNKRVVFPKGSVSSAYTLRNKLNRIPAKHVDALLDIVKASLVKRFGTLEKLGNVYIDDALFECPLPTAQRSASKALKQTARGTRLPLTIKDNLRFFIHWSNIGDEAVDVDLSASFFDKDLKFISDVAYYNLEEGQCSHSGDITDAPGDGASEFLDVNVDYVLNEMKARYVVMSVLSFTRQTFAEIGDAFVGWMSRDAIGSNEIYEPKTVEQKIDLSSDSTHSIPVIFDLKEMKVINVDINSSGRTFNNNNANNAENNRADFNDLLEAFVKLENKISLYSLFELHATARGTLVKDKAQADIVFDLDGDITPFDIAKINNNYII